MHRLNNFFQKHAHEYAAIWVNLCILSNIDWLKYAKKYGINCRILHSHNSQNMENKIKLFLHKFAMSLPCNILKKKGDGIISLIFYLKILEKFGWLLLIRGKYPYGIDFEIFFTLFIY